MVVPKSTTVIGFLVALWGLVLAVVAVARNPETKPLPIVVCLLLLSGTLFYWLTEDWSFIEALYFSVVTLTTVGYGGLTPTSDYSRIFTIIYIFIGIGVLVAFLTSLSQEYTRQKAEDADRLLKHLSAHAHHSQPPDEGGSQ